MKKKRLKRKEPQVKVVESILTEQTVVDPWDSISFDTVSKEKIVTSFNRHYSDHVEALLDITMSRLALGTALTNVNNAVSDETSNSIDLDEDGNITNAMDNIYTRALLLYVTEHSLKIAVSEDLKLELLKSLDSKFASILRKSSTKEESYPIAVSATHGKDSKTPVERNITRLSKKMGINEDEEVNPYGIVNPPEEKPSSSKEPLKKAKTSGIIQRRHK